MLRRALVVSFATLGLLLSAALPAAGEPICIDGQCCETTTGVCTPIAISPGSPGAPPGGGSGGSSTFSGCTTELMSPQPPLPPGTVIGYAWGQEVCYQNGVEVSRGVPVLTPVNLLTPLVDPRVLAQQAIAELQLTGPIIGSTPAQRDPFDPTVYALVGGSLWLWSEPSPQSTGPISATATAGAVSVTATANALGVVWDMGDGVEGDAPGRVECGLGTPYPEGGSGGRPSPTCGYTYERASSNYVDGACVDDPLDSKGNQLCGGPWTITATTTWEVTWTGGGMTGVVGFDMSTTGQIMIRELYVLNRD